MMTIDNWKNVHPLLKTVPVDWSYTIPFGLLHSPRPSATGKAVFERGQNSLLPLTVPARCY